MREKNLILRGRVPQAPGEIVVGKSFFEQNPSVEIGDRLNLVWANAGKEIQLWIFFPPFKAGKNL